MKQDQTLSESTLGLALDDPGLAEVLSALDPGVKWKPDDGQTDWVSRKAGADVQGDTEDNQVTTVFFYNDGVQKHKRYAGPLPRGLEFAWNRAEVVKHLGPPTISGPKHDCWTSGVHRLVVNYDGEGVITLVGVTSM